MSVPLGGWAGVDPGAEGALLRHDWAYRWARILEIAGLNPSPCMEIRRKTLKALARHGGFALETAYDKLDADQQRLILHGSEAWVDLEPGGIAGNANLPIGGKKDANREIGVPRFVRI